jgi:hypothetical protein
MTCYLISQGGEPVALVVDIDMARAIAGCQPWGEYLVEPIEVGDPISRRPSRARRSSLVHRPARARRRPKEQPAGWNPGIPADGIDGALRHAR